MVHGGRCSLVGACSGRKPHWALQAHNNLAQQALLGQGAQHSSQLVQQSASAGRQRAHPALARAGANHKYTYRKEEPELGVGEAQRNHLQQRVESRVEVQVTGTLQGANKKLALEGTDGVCSGAAEQPPDYCRQQKRNALQQPDTVIPATHDVEVAAGKSPTFSTPASDSSTYLETSHRAVGNL
ncbi:hypothetical protein WJX77_004761 [Trebouxia sp. C0004]